MSLALSIDEASGADFRTDAAIADRFRAVRGISRGLIEGLSAEDLVVQSMEDASPAKWHLAHTSWYFEEFILAPHAKGYRRFHPHYAYLFNSYYDNVGERHARPRRGTLTRPSLDEVLAYRVHVDDAMASFLDEAGSAQLAALTPLVELGLNHEQQHQELLLTDLLHAFSHNPLCPAYRDPPAKTRSDRPAADLKWISFDAGVRAVGHGGDGFAFDSEGPRHDVLVQPFRLASRLVTNGEWRAFIADGGYAEPTLWLSDGWACREREGWQAPLYWRGDGDDWLEFGLNGLQPLDDVAPVCHVSYYEADAFARWAGKRLAREHEWEVAAAGAPVAGNTLGSGHLRPTPADDGDGLQQLYGHAWEWTQSPYVPYPGFRPAAGAVGEYNGKFMCNQMVLRGGSCVTPEGHIRATYRNFFYPHQRWQFMGVRLAEDG